LVKSGVMNMHGETKTLGKYKITNYKAVPGGAGGYPGTTTQKKTNKAVNFYSMNLI
jgi:hypothetical protein